jgi:formate-dependent nitrite reductase cytochrome c552 subunit
VANLTNRTPGDFKEFHQAVTSQFAHGKISCLSCHDPNDYDRLRLADGQAVPYTEVMTLCGQCHGPQTRDYAHGAHGGMNGYWDLSRGPRTRNNCVDCHDPHAPQFPDMQPTFKPRDRFLSRPDPTETGKHE